MSSSNRGVMFQFFHWNLPADGSLWRNVSEQAHELKNLGMTAVWLPPAYKAADGSEGVGYAVYDLFDLGEFDQKGSTCTKYGTKQEFLDAVKSIRDAGMHAYADIVLNHRVGADECEEVLVDEVDANDRQKVLQDGVRLNVHSKFTFPGRGGKYSSMIWTAKHFTAFGYPSKSAEPCRILRLHGKSFSEEVSHENGNFDFLLGADVDFRDEDVRSEMTAWGNWFVRTTNVDGFRLDAVKHMPAWFYRDWLAQMRTDNPDRELFAVGEYWENDVQALRQYHAATAGQMRLLDVPLHFRFHAASQSPEFDLRTIFDGTWVQADAINAVTFVDNHDTQPGQSLESFVADWFKPHAYALILLREQGYPCVFHGDYFGDERSQPPLTAHRKVIDDMLRARALYTLGSRHDCFDSPHYLAWSWIAESEYRAMAVVMSNGDAAVVKISVPPRMTFRDVLGHVVSPVTSDAMGNAEFPCNARSVSVWCSADVAEPGNHNV